MKSLIITYKGFEQECSGEVLNLLKADVEIADSVVIAEVKSEKEICMLTYALHSAIKVLELFDKFQFKNISEIESWIEKLDLKKYLTKNKSFVVRCLRVGDHDFQANDVERAVGAVIHEKYKNPVKLDDPDYIFYLYLIGSAVYFGLDYSGIDLSKREYKIFSHPSALKGTVAFLLLKNAGYDKKKVLLDPFLGSGTIPIEAALTASAISPHFYSKSKLAFNKFIDFDYAAVDEKIKRDKLNVFGFDHSLQSVSSAKKNAKVAGVDKIINISRVDVEWIDTKCDKETVDLVVTNPPMASKIHSSEMVEKLYKEFFYQLDFVLKKKGKIVMISRKTELLKKQSLAYNFKLDSDREVLAGKELFHILTFVKRA